MIATDLRYEMPGKCQMAISPVVNFGCVPAAAVQSGGAMPEADVSRTADTESECSLPLVRPILHLS